VEVEPKGAMTMRDIITLLAGELLGGREPEPAGSEPDDDRRLFAPTRGDGRDARPADWCQTPPGEASLGWLAAGLRARPGARRR
jgi:hypothetical protein